MKLYREYEELMIKILGILGAIMLAVLFIALLAKFAMKFVMMAVLIMGIMFAAGALYLIVCILIDFDEKFGLK